MKRFHIIFTLLLIVFFAIGLTACKEEGSSTLGNGRVDPGEAAALRVAVGLAFTARPDTVAPAYAVSTAVLAVLGDGSTPVPLDSIDGLIGKETAKLKLAPATLQSFNDLILLVKAQVTQQLGTNADIKNTLVVVHDVVQVVQQTAAARLGIPTVAAPVVTPVPATSVPAPAAPATPFQAPTAPAAPAPAPATPATAG